MGDRFECELINVEKLLGIIIATYEIRDVNTGKISIQNELTSGMVGEVRVTGRPELFNDIPTKGTYEGILKHFELWEKIST